MKLRKAVSFLMITVLAGSLCACGNVSGTNTGNTGTESDSGDSEENEDSREEDQISGEDATAGTGSDSEYASIELGKTGKDLDTVLTFLSDRTEIVAADGSFAELSDYISRFEEEYPGIRIELEDCGEEDPIRMLEDGTECDLCMIPEDTDPSGLPGVFASYGTKEALESEVSYVNSYTADGEVYGIPIAADAAGILYNRKVLEDAGCTSLPRTPDEFIDVLRTVGDRTDAIPLYTNYNEDFAMSLWDSCIGGCATGDYSFLNRKLALTKDPFAADPGDAGVGPYAVYKILYDAAAKGLTEREPSGTDFGESLRMLADGEIFSMVIGSYAVPMARGLSEDPDTVGFMTFPITVSGKQYAAVLPDSGFGIPADADEEHRLAAEIFVKWMTEKSGIAEDMGALSADKENTVVPEVLAELDDENIVFVEESEKGTELASMNRETGLYIHENGSEKIRELIDHALSGELMFDQIMTEWNDRWTESQEKLGIEPLSD